MSTEKAVSKNEQTRSSGSDSVPCSPVFLRLRDDLHFRNKVSDLLNSGDFSPYADARFDNDWDGMEKGLKLLSEWGNRAKAILQENATVEARQ